MKRSADAGTSPVPEEGDPSGAGMFRYRTENMNAGMSMPAALTSMPMPSYDLYPICTIWSEQYGTRKNFPDSSKVCKQGYTDHAPKTKFYKA